MQVAYNAALLRQPFSGVEHAILHLATALAAGGEAAYTFFVPPRYPGPDFAGPRSRTVRTRWPTHLRPLRIVWEQALLPGRVRTGYDLLHAPGYIAPLRAHLPIVLTVYDLLALDQPARCTLVNRLHYGLMLPRSIRRADGIIVPSAATREALLARFPAVTPRLVTIPLGIDAGFRPLPPGSAAARVRTAFGLQGPYLLFVGNLEPKKNLPRLVDAFQQLRQEGFAHRLVLAGHPAWDAESVRQRIAAHGLADAVSLTGPVAPDDLVCLYNAAEAFVFPSLDEGFGLPPLEAMACGVPVVTSTAGALPGVVGDAALCVNPRDTAELVAALRKLLTDPALRRSLVERGLRRAARYTWPAAATATESFYATVLERVRRERAAKVSDL